MQRWQLATALLVLAACAHGAAARKQPKDLQQPRTLYDIVSTMPEVSHIFQKVVEVGLDKQFQKPNLGITAFIPSNKAYDKITALVGNDPTILSNTTIIKAALAYHIINKPLEKEQFPQGISSMPTALGQAVTVTVNDKTNTFKVGAYNVTVPDIQAGKSVIHVIDGFLIAPSLLPTLIEATRASKMRASAHAVTGAAAPQKP